MVFSDPHRVDIGPGLRIIGMVIGQIGIYIGAIATIEKKSYSDPDNLIESGIYSKPRNPIYLGIILIHIGMPLSFGSMVS